MHNNRRWWIGGILTAIIGTGTFLLPNGVATPLTANAQTQASLSEGSRLLQEYNAAFKALPALPNLQFRQQIRLTGSQTFTATLDVLSRQDGSWQAWVSEGNRIRLLDSATLKSVSQSNVLQLYTVYVTQPDALLPTVTLRLEAPTERYQVTTVQSVPLGDTPAIQLTLKPTGEGQLRELWLDPQTKLPRKALLFLSGVWGQAYVLIEFQKVQTYWLPSSMQVNLGYGFWTLSGLSQRTFTGSVSLRHDYQDYQVLPDSPQPSFASNRPPVDRPPQVATTPSQVLSPGSVRSLGKDSAGNEQFSIGVGGQSQTPIQEQINAFNLTRPSTRNAQTQIDTLAQLSLGAATLPLYLFQFDTGEPIAPLQPGNPLFDPRQIDPLKTQSPSIKLLGQ